MARTIMLVPVGFGVGLTSVSMGIVHALERHGIKVNFFKPIAQPSNGDTGPERSTAIIGLNPNIKPPQPFAPSYVANLMSGNKADTLLEEIVERANKALEGNDILVIEGMVPTRKQQYSSRLNNKIATALDAEVVFVTSPGADSAIQQKERIEIACQSFGGTSSERILGCIVNQINAPIDEHGVIRPDLAGSLSGTHQKQMEVFQLFGRSPIRVLGYVPWNEKIIAPRVIDLANHLKAKVINEGQLHSRRLRSISFCARSIPNMVDNFNADKLLVASGDRSDVIVSVCLAAMNGVKIGALLLTNGYEPEEPVMKLCEQAMATGLPILLVETNTWQTSIDLQSFNHEVPIDDTKRIYNVQEFMASHIDKHWISSLTQVSSRERRLSPAAFRYKLTEMARTAGKTIVLPEGEEPRTIKAAAICSMRNIANCILLGNPEAIELTAKQQGLELGPGVSIIDPEQVRQLYVAPMVKLREHKGITDIIALEQLQDNVVLGSMMLALGEVDGLVSGAVHTTANTIRPPLQLVKTAPNTSLVSSIFFMLLPDQVLIYGDCAINPDPTAEQLAEIAIQSADSATAFGIQPKVAMISYSTGTSGSGSDVEKVREATELAKQKRPDLVIDGPLQYDAAVMKNVAASKAPNSPVAGQANVFIFPDLNTGNTTYKAVQRSADLISIGPMLQGMKKPVNDLSRGALVDDIVYTIALTAIQGQQAEENEYND
ncbi:phosphate acetyltransferase [Psychrobium sp. 1_MG-2023]|uniref:phosphate acetyltransferase n=1 Tax=Psychrobium sp. 1_MG-2023 TaxID=3062624 RepID=UPI000C3295AC|nr:phosphate acetyltransferase [Psychrobium sp. 1_MG-2023]MDP2560220.1 phosphate acetyltransferase [Psychrobium sp. 1_MG-2023]PKF57031.1 phosphate acetyltransferase [Alteromonadales bacterium alter-6D02]